MKKRIFVRILTVILVLVLCVMPALTSASAAVVQENMITTSSITDGVFWSNASNGATVSKTLAYDQTKSLSALNLTPIAVSGGLYAYGFTWTSSKTSVATVNSSTGEITTYKQTGTTVITGTSRTFSDVGNLYLILFVSDKMTDVTLIAIPEDGYDRASSFNAIIDDLYYAGHNVTRKIISVLDSNKFQAYLATSKILLFRGHGTKTSIVLHLERDESGAVAYQTGFHTYNMSTHPADAFAYCELLVYGSCLTGQGRENATNLVNATVDHGVATVVGFEQVVHCYEMNEWAMAFFNAISEGATVTDACAAGDLAIENSAYSGSYINDQGICGTTTHYIGGDDTATFR